MKLDGADFVTYSYDNGSRVNTIVRGTNVFDFGYDAADKRIGLTWPNGLKTIYAYDAASQVKSIKVQNGATLLDKWLYDYDVAGNRTKKQGTDYTETYPVYDDLYRLRQVKRGASVTEAYTYDAVGNRLSSLGQPTWSYNDRNELQSSGTAAFTYNANGSTESKVEGANTLVYEWNVDNQLERVLKNGVEAARFGYDPLGRRIKKIAAGVTTTYTYDGEDIVRTSVGTATTRYVHGPGIDEPLARIDPSGTTYLHADALGSITKTSTATVASFKEYDAFGDPVVGTATSSYAFTGREWDAEIGLYYYRARYYDPETGRFISEDPIAFAGGLNFYDYAQGNPAVYVDPSGLKAWRCKKPLVTLGGRGQRSGPDVGGNPLYHQYHCVLRFGVMTCGGQDHSGSAGGSPGKPSQDTYDPKNCEPIVLHRVKTSAFAMPSTTPRDHGTAFRSGQTAKSSQTA